MRQEHTNDDSGADRNENHHEDEDVQPAESELEEERPPSPDFPEVPGRDVGATGTRDVDPPPNTESPAPPVPEPPD